MLLALRTLTDPKIMLAVSLATIAIGMPTAPTTELGPFNSEASTALVSVVIRPETGNLGDARFWTGASFRIGGGVPGPTPASGVAEVMATGPMQDVSANAIGAIDSVVFHAIATIPDLGPWNGNGSYLGLYGSPNIRLAWKVNGLEAQGSAINDDPTVTGQLVIVRDVDGFDANDNVPLDRGIHTAAILTQPNGNPWTWAAVNALADPAVRYSWAGAGSTTYFDLDVWEVWAEVFGQGGGGNPRRKIHFKLGAGCARQEITGGVNRTKLTGGGPLRFTVPV